ncbi:MAG TPA: metal-dependent hydrolase [Terriglobia bacterium]
MFLGHFGLGLAAKKASPKTSLGTLWMAAQFLDLIWPIFLLLGWERVDIDPGNTVVTPLDFVSYPLSHSLLGAAGWAFLFAGLYWLIRRDAEGTFFVWALVLSHWLLDAVVHRPDLPLYPGSGRMFGLGLWNSRPTTLLLEGLIFIWGVSVYRRATKARDAVGTYAFRTLVIFLALIYVMSVLGPPPPDSRTVAVMGLGQWLLILWAYWVDRHREPVIPNLFVPADASSVPPGRASSD